MADHTYPTPTSFTLAGLLPPLIAAGLFAIFLQALPIVADGGTLRYAVSWAPSLGVDLSFFIDGLSLTFALLISGIGTLVMLFSARYMAGNPQHGRFSLYLTLFMLAMLGLVLADNLIALFVFWELTSITSFLLIGFSHVSANARRCALQALLVTGFGGLAMLAGFLLLGGAAGTLELSEIRAMGDAMREHALYVPILILLLLGAFTKSAQMPFHFWLPNAMAAPTPVSAYLHSATMVKGGVYLMARVYPSFSGTDLWFWTLMLFGGVTAVFASVVALRQTDLKQTLAYTTLMALGSLTLFLAAPGAYAVTAMATFLIVHSLYKAALFLMIGCVDHVAGTRDARRLGGLVKAMPITAMAAALAALSMAGVPPFFGFIGKELLYKGALDTGMISVLFTAFILLASALMFAVAGVVALRPFWGSSGQMPEAKRDDLHEAPLLMLAGPVVLGGLGLVFGLAPHFAEHNFVAPIVGSLMGDADLAKHLHLWGGLNLALLLSLVTFGLGAWMYLRHERLRDGIADMAELLPNFDRMWDALLQSLLTFSGAVTTRLQSGVLSRYMAVVFATILIGFGATILLRGLDIVALRFDGINVVSVSVAALTIMGTVLTLLASSRIAAIGGLGTVGIGVALFFVIYGAPDVAITQLLVEMLVVVLFSVAALRLPVLTRRKPIAKRKLHALLSIGIGVVTTAILIGVTSGVLDERLTEFFEKSSYPDAFGRNIVNVILVDFRAFDTFGEISVVVIAALAAVALLRQKKSGDSA